MMVDLLGEDVNLMARRQLLYQRDGITLGATASGREDAVEYSNLQALWRRLPSRTKGYISVSVPIHNRRRSS